MASTAKEFLIQPAKRTTIVVSDMQRSRHFYEECLGLVTFYEGFVDNPGASAILGHECAGLNMVVLRSDHRSLGMIGLMEVVDPIPPLPSYQPAGSLRIGETVMVIPTTDMDRLMRRLQAAGADIVSEPVRLEIPQRGEIREVFVRDPDGVMLNFSQHGPLE